MILRQAPTTSVSSAIDGQQSIPIISVAPFWDPNSMFMKDCGGEDDEKDQQCMEFEEKNVQFGSHGFHHQPENYFNGNACPPLPSAHSASPQLFFGATSFFPTYPSYGTTTTGLSQTQNDDQSHAGEDHNTD
ncbi:hypothetical protein F3Y22_tig00111847pilonHSYRG00313 [Hibiscus syriacus]|uniref:Uncharacterized protein n=1 Tax=Hibiscus syriacus TaxID=106335 RepID=A0A6A2XR43_HIBSY|nr:hypothetical protein F3Y22_tig00111847pilonHSYRG00313 [Hibiscus syriacus]